MVYRLAEKKVEVDRVPFEIDNPVESENYWTRTSRTLLDALIPDDPDCIDFDLGPPTVVPPEALFSTREARAANKRLNNKTAPGEDTIEPKMIKALLRNDISERMKDLANECLRIADRIGCTPPKNQLTG